MLQKKKQHTTETQVFIFAQLVTWKFLFLFHHNQDPFFIKDIFIEYRPRILIFIWEIDNNLSWNVYY